jgi:PrtD family type I secretion system ABC transporter
MFKQLEGMWLYETLKEFKDAYKTVFIFSAVINILILAPAWYMLQVYDRVLTSYDDNTLFGLSIIVIFLFIIYGLLERYRRLILVSSTEGLDEKILDEVKKKFIKGDQNTTRKLQNTFRNLNVIKQFITGQPALSFIDVPWFFIYILVLFLIHFQLGFIALIATAVLCFLAILNQKLTGEKFMKASKSVGKENLFIGNIIHSADSAFVMGMNENLFNRLLKSREVHLNEMFAANKESVWINSTTKFFRILVQSGILGYGAYLAINEQITFGMIIAASILLGRTLAPIEGVINNWKTFLEFKKSFFSLNETYQNIKNDETSIDLGEPEGLIEANKAFVSLIKDQEPILKNINLIIKPTESVVILGPSGAGKTTLLKTLCGIFRPIQGQVTLDGTHLTNRDWSHVGKHFGYLSQTTSLLKGKISENIARFGDIDNDAVIEAAKKVNIHDYIIKLPKGYETELGENGSGLSDGQARRIAIARALYKNPKIIFLDEPSLALDHHSIASLVELIKELREKKKTLVFTSHNPMLAQLAEKAILIVNGEIKVFGNAKEILPKLTIQKKPNEIN